MEMAYSKQEENQDILKKFAYIWQIERSQLKARTQILLFFF